MTTITLSHPIQAHGEEVTELTLARPLVKHLKAVDDAKGDVERTAALIGALAGLTPSEVDRIDAEDFVAIGEAVTSFFAPPQPTGGP